MTTQPPMPPMQSAMPSGIQVSLNTFPMAWLALLHTPRVEINGVVHLTTWGTHFFPLMPGMYQIAIYYPHMFSSTCGWNTATVYVQPGRVSQVLYDGPPLIFLRGSITVIA